MQTNPHACRRALVPLMLCVALVALTACGGSSNAKSSATTTTTAPSKTTTPTGAEDATNTTATTASPGTSRPVAVAPSGGCGQVHASGQSSESFAFQGKARTYQLYVPPVYDGTRAVPVVFNFHGFGSNAIEQMVYGNFKPLANQYNFLIVAPDGQDSPNGRHFNLTRETGLQNDITMTLSLLDHIEQTFCVDTNRVFAAGMSDGGAMTSVLACTASNRFAAFGAVAVVVSPPQCIDHSVAISAYSGTADPIVPFNGGKVNCCGGAVVASARSAMGGWAAHNRCTPAPNEVRLASEVRRQTWTGCTGRSAVVFYIIDGGGHTWPGSISVAGLGMTTKQINASNTIWAFFAAHPLQPN